MTQEDLYEGYFDDDPIDLAKPPFEVGDAEAWGKWVEANSDGGYGEAVIRYAAHWGELMEKKMAAGEELEAIADAASHEANKRYGITGFQYGAAVSTLATSWAHGERLRKWHNLKTQIKGEGEKANEAGGVLNPALLNVGGA